MGENYIVPCSSISSLDAELPPINATLILCLQVEAENMCILLDSKCATESLKRPHSNDYTFHITEIRTLLIQLRRKGKIIASQWVPVHCGIVENEQRADEIAKASVKMHPNKSQQMFLLML